MRVILALLVAAIATASAQASTVLFFQPTSATTTVLGGPSITVDLILSETVTSNINNFGVAGASFTITRGGSGTIGAPVGNVAFDISNAGGADPVVTLDQTSILGIGQGSSQVVLGSFVINATSEGNGTLSVSAFGGPNDIAVYTDNVGTLLTLSPGIFTGVANFTYTITAVPEPSSAALLAIAGIASIHFRRRRAANA
jgi:hypothetical protein